MKLLGTKGERVISDFRVSSCRRLRVSGNLFFPLERTNL